MLKRSKGMLGFRPVRAYRHRRLWTIWGSLASVISQFPAVQRPKDEFTDSMSKGLVILVTGANGCITIVGISILQARSFASTSQWCRLRDFKP